MLFDIPAYGPLPIVPGVDFANMSCSADNTNYNPMSPYTFYDVSCPAELPVRKRQLDIELPGGGGINISLGLGSPREISSACSCYITRGPAETTVTTTATNNVTRTATATQTVTRTPDDAAVAGDEPVEEPAPEVPA
tara:strand:- start:13309 stop:13719 length:411 start_codon:yes stop_codon:yes gene_type:complete